MFTAITDANAEILEQNAQRRAAVEELAAVPWKGVESRARRKAMRTAIDAMPPFRRVTGPSTRQHVKATLRAALNEAIGQQIITFNPAAHVKIDPVRKPKALVWTDERVARWQQTGEKPSPVMVWTPEQTGAFLDFVAADRLYAMWHVIAFRGLRRGEACGQPWSETNLDRHSLTVTGQLVQDGWDVEASKPKTDSGFRVVALDDDTVNVLERHRKQQEADREEWGPPWVETGLLFTQEDGSWLHPGKVTDLFERLVAASGLPPIRLHDLRHGAATLMLAMRHRREDRLGHSRAQRHPHHAGHLPERPPPRRQELSRGHRQAGPAPAQVRGGEGPQGRPQGRSEGESPGQGEEEQGAEEAQEVGHRAAPLTHRSRKPSHGTPAV